MQGPYMELVNKLSFKGIVNLKSVSDVNNKIDKIISKKNRLELQKTLQNYSHKSGKTL